MKVLHYVDELNLAWGETWIQLLLALANRGVQNHVACRGGGSLEKRLKDANISFDTCRPLTQLLPLTDWRFGKIIDDFKPALIHTRLSAAANIGGWWGKHKHVPVLQTIDKYPKLKYHRNSSFYAACSSSVMDYFLQQGAAEDKITVIHNPIDVKRYSLDANVRRTFRMSKNVSANTKIILGAGRFVDWKGFDILIRSYDKFYSDNPNSDSELWIVGGGEEKETLTSLAKASLVKDRIKIFPFTQDLKPYMQAADLFVLPSKKPEPFGIVLLEAMASSLPVIATRAGGPLDIVTDESGWFCRADDDESLSVRIGEALRDSAETRLKGRNARKRAEYFGIERIATETVALYEKVGAMKI